MYNINIIIYIYTHYLLREREGYLREEGIELLTGLNGKEKKQ